MTFPGPESVQLNHATLDPSYLSAFPSPPNEAWLAAVEKVLKGAAFEKRLVARTADGIRLEPLYPAATTPARALRSESGRWQVATRLDHPNPAEAEALAVADLEGGADTLTISFAGAPAARGYGLIANSVTELGAALEGVMLDLIRLRLDPAPEGRINALLLAALIERRGYIPAELTVEFGLDPIGAFARSGFLPAPWPEIRRQLWETIRILQQRGFRGPFIAVDSRPYHETGASEAQELGAVFATGVTYLRALEAQGMPLADARNTLAFTLVADTDEFLTVAKFRAARLLWDRIQQACGLSPTPARIHAETAWRALTKRDPHVNLLRGTIAAFSAGIGGADSLTVQPFTAALGLPDAFARRAARNTQLILLEESNLWRVADPAAGAGGFEALTQALCEQAWIAFQDIERQTSDELSGIIAGLSNGFVQTTLAKQRAARLKAIATRREPITGTSEFAHIREGAVTALDVPRIALEDPCPSGILAERNQGEIIRSFVAGAGRADARIASAARLQTDALLSIRFSEPFEILRDKADFLPQRPVIFLATLGSIADFTARAAFARNLFEAGGLTAPNGDSFATDGHTNLDAMVAAFRASGAKLACLCGSDPAYSEEGAAAAEALTAAGATVWLAGRPEDGQKLKKAGVTWSIYSGCDAVEALEWAHALCARRV